MIFIQIARLLSVFKILILALFNDRSSKTASLFHKKKWPAIKKSKCKKNTLLSAAQIIKNLELYKIVIYLLKLYNSIGKMSVSSTWQICVYASRAFYFKAWRMQQQLDVSCMLQLWAMKLIHRQKYDHQKSTFYAFVIHKQNNPYKNLPLRDMYWKETFLMYLVV